MADRILKRLLRERFIFSLANGETFDGLLIEADERTVRVANARAITKTSSIEVNGDLFIPRGDILYMQKPRTA